MRARFAFLVLCAALALACRKRRPHARVAAHSSASHAQATSVPTLPRLVATDGGIAVNNLDAQISSAESRLPDRGAREGLVDLLLARGEYLGSIADYERAATIADGLVTEAPTDGAGLRARASVYATFHRFDAALADLAEAEKNGVSADKLAKARASIAAATGRYDDAAKLLPPLDEALSRAMDYATWGLLHGEMGDMDECARLLDRARDKYVDVSPFPLAWMDVQEARLLALHGDAEKARAHYVRALSLLPTYAHAAAHLAPMSKPAEAIEILSKLTRADDPEIELQLAEALRKMGKSAEAKAHLDAALARYDALVTNHPEAFADHAAWAFLGPGRDPARALSLAKENVALRKTVESYDLYLSAALAAKDDAAACDAAKGATALPYPTDALRSLAAPLLTRCGSP